MLHRQALRLSLGNVKRSYCRAQSAGYSLLRTNISRVSTLKSHDNALPLPGRLPKYNQALEIKNQVGLVARTLPGNTKFISTKEAPSASAVDLNPLKAHLRAQGQPHDLRSFLLNERKKQLQKEAASLKANPSEPAEPKRLSFTYLGTRYEYLTQSHLAGLKFDLVVVGGRGDSGIDLVGTWTLPVPATSPDSGPSQRICKVLVQCKRLAPNRSPTPSLIRELEGAVSNSASSVTGILPATFRASDVLGVLVCTRPATEGIMKAIRGSRRGLIWICLAEEDVTENDVGIAEQGVGKSRDDPVTPEHEYVAAVDKTLPRTRVLQMAWNSAASQIGLEGFNVGMKYDAEGRMRDAVLTWQGHPVQLLQ